MPEPGEDGRVPRTALVTFVPFLWVWQRVVIFCGGHVGVMSLFETMTDQGRQVIVLAQQEARDLNHTYLGTEHLLLGLLAEGRGAGAAALTSLGVSLDITRDAVAALVGRGRQSPPHGHIPFTSRSRQALELAVRETVQLGHPHLGTGHLLLGIARLGSGVAVQILITQGADMKLVRERVLQQLHDDPDGEGARSQTSRAGHDAGMPSLNSVLLALAGIEARLAAIEQHLGIKPPDPSGA